MQNKKQKAAMILTALLSLVAFTRSTALADDDLATIKARLAELEQQNQTMKARLSELESSTNENWLTQERTNQIKQIVTDVLADSKSHEKSSGYNVGYNNGFFIQSDDQNFKLSIGGVLQVRYEFASHYANNALYTTKPLPQGDHQNASGFDIRRARLNFTGNVFSPNLFYRFEGDFYGSSTGGFTVTDAYLGYIFNDQFKIRAGRASRRPSPKASRNMTLILSWSARRSISPLTLSDPSA